MARFPQALILSSFCALLGCSAGSQSPAIASPPAPEITVVGVGDILLGRQLGTDMKKSGDYNMPFRDMGRLLTEADITFGNLEGTFCEKPPWPVDGVVFRLDPTAVKSLVAGGFDVVSVANNHFGDGGSACIAFSLEHLRAHGIGAPGAGTTYEEAHTAAILERQGVKFAFLAYTYAQRNDRKNVGASLSSPAASSPSADSSRKEVQLKLAPTKERIGRPVIAGRAPENVRRDVQAALQKADVVIVSLHDGAEYLQRIAKETEEFARAAIDAGATAVFGHHPHVPQRVEQYKAGWIFYSLGNFVFQQNTPPNVRHALIARLTFRGKLLAQVEAIPAYIETYARPRPVTSEEAEKILKAIGIASPVLWKAVP